MSTINDLPDPEDDSDPWDELAGHRETLEMLAAEDVPFSDRAQYLLDRLDEEGY